VPARRATPVLIPSYNGARKIANLVPLLALLALSFLFILERAKTGTISLRSLALCGSIGGIACATRLDVSSLVFFSGLVLLSLSLRLRAFWSALFAMLTFVVLDPFLWRSPASYLGNIYAQVRSLESVPVAHMSAVSWFHSLLLVSPPAFLSVALWLPTLIFYPTALPVPLSFVVWLIAVTTVMVSVFLLAPFAQVWYLYPFLALWEIMLPLLVLALIEASSSMLSFGRRRAEMLLVTLLLVAYTLPFGIVLSEQWKTYRHPAPCYGGATTPD